MKKLILSLGMAAVTALSMPLFAQDFVPEEGVKYSFKHKGSELYVGGRADNFAGLMSPTKKGAAAIEFTVEETVGGYYLVNGDGLYLYKDGYNSKMGAKGDASVVDFLSTAVKEEEGGGEEAAQAEGDAPEYFRIITGGNCFAPDAVADGEKLYSDKSLTFGNGEYEIVKSSEISYPASIKLAMTSVSIQKENEGANSATLRFTPVNFDGEVTIAASDGITVEPATITVADCEEYTVTISTAAEIGSEGGVSFSFGGEVLATANVAVTDPAPTYYIFNLETGLVLGGDSEKAILTELTMEETQRFSKVEVPGTNRYYLIQKSSGLYFRNVDSGSGVMAHYCEYGASAERAEWSFPENGEGVSLKNSKQDRILIPTKLGEGAQVMCYGLNSDAGSKWQLIETSEFGQGEPTVDITDENVLVEPNGISFTTEVRAYNLEGGVVTVKPSAGVNVSISTIEEGYKRQPLTISTTAKAGTECRIDFVLGTEVLRTLTFTVSERFPRYIFRYVSEGTDLALGSADESAQPILKAYSLDDLNQQMILMPVDENGDGEITEDEGYYIVQESSYGYFTCTGGWDTTFGTPKGAESIFHFEMLDEEAGTFNIRTSKGLLDADDITDGAKVYSNKAKGTWKRQAVGEINVSNEEVILADRAATETVSVTAVGLKEGITVTTTGAARADVTSLPAEGGQIVVSLDAASQETAGTIELTSGDFTRTIDVRLKATTMSVDKEAVEITGKRGKAFFTVSATDITEPIVIAVEGEGFAANVQTIEPATNVARDVTVTYSGRTEATGKVTVSCGSMKKEVAVSVKFNPDIVLDTEGFVLDEGVAYFAVTGVDLFDPITVSSTTEGIDIAPAELDADAKEDYVFVTVPSTVPAGDIVLTIASGSVSKTLTLKHEAAGIGAAVAAGEISVVAADGVIRVAGAAEGARLTVADLTGRSIAADASVAVPVAVRGIYLVRVVNPDGSSKCFKVVM